MTKTIESTLQAILDEAVAEGSERGAQAAVYWNGQLAADVCAGVADPATGRRVTNDTLFPVFSTTKGIAATLIHLLVERGKIGYDTRIVEVWPEFGAHGKEGITLRHALSHTAGLANMPMGLSLADLHDWATMCAAIADLKPLTPPGVVMAYHAKTYGWIVGEVARRVDGRPFSHMLRDEITGPLHLTTSMYVGIPDEAESRVAILEMPVDESAGPPPDDTIPQPILALTQPLHAWMNRPDARRSCLPASSGIMTAHAVARHYAALLPGGVDGVELLPPARVRAAIELQPPGTGTPDGTSGKKALGYTREIPFSATAFGHGGYGGSLGFADLASGLAFGFTRNLLIGDATLTRIMAALRSALDS